MRRFCLGLCSWLFHHPRLVVVTAFLLTVSGLVGGANLYAWHHYRASRVAREEMRFAEARQHIRQCLRVWSGSSTVHLWAARLARLDGDFSDAEHHLVEAKRLAGVSEASQLEWVLLRARRGEIDVVAPGLWRCVEENHPERTEILETMARTYASELRLGPALNCLDRWIEEDPTSFRALALRGQVRQSLQEVEYAEFDYIQALEIRPRDLDVGIRLVTLQLGLNRARQQIEPYLRRLQQVSPEDRRVRVLGARYHMLCGEFDEARRLLDDVLAEDSKNVDALVQRGLLEQQDGKPAEAEKWLTRALAEEPGDTTTLFALYRAINAQKGREKEAQEILRRRDLSERDLKRIQELVQRSNRGIHRDPRAAAEFGLLLMRFKATSVAVGWLEIARQLDPRNKEVRRVLAEHYDRTGDKQKAAQVRKELAAIPAAEGKGS